jgi:hypothetical protein
MFKKERVVMDGFDRLQEVTDDAKNKLKPKKKTLTLAQKKPQLQLKRDATSCLAPFHLQKSGKSVFLLIQPLITTIHSLTLLGKEYSDSSLTLEGIPPSLRITKISET